MTKEQMFWREFKEYLPDIEGGEVDKEAVFDDLVDVFHDLENDEPQNEPAEYGQHRADYTGIELFPGTKEALDSLSIKGGE